MYLYFLKKYPIFIQHCLFVIGVGFNSSLGTEASLCFITKASTIIKICACFFWGVRLRECLKFWAYVLRWVHTC